MTATIDSLEQLLTEASENGFTPEIEQAFMDGLPGVFARVRGLEAENAAAGRNVYRMQTANAALVEALQPFSQAANNIPKRWPNAAICELSTECGPSDIPENCERARLIISMDGISVGDIRRARAALTLKETEDV